jgi:hypothetical protein
VLRAAVIFPRSGVDIETSPYGHAIGRPKAVTA